MIEFYIEIRQVHVAAVFASGALFLLRGLVMIGGWPRLARAAPVRYLSHAIDTTLLTAALMLMTIVRQYPFVQAWLTIKVLLLVVYIVLGFFALSTTRTRRSRTLLWVAALAVYLFIISIARTRNPLGFLGVMS